MMLKKPFRDVGLATLLVTSVAGFAAQEHFTPKQLVDALHSAFGKHHARAVHTKGIILFGTFEPDSQAATLTKAPHMQKAKSNVIVRFSDFTGIPDISDGNPLANPRGFAIRFEIPNGGVTDIVGHSFNGFPVSTTDEFRNFLMSIAASGPDASKPTALDRFLESHPIAKKFVTTQKTPASYATLSYFGVNSFQFINQTGESRFIRYQFIPEQGEQLITADDAAKKSPNYLQDEIKTRIAQSPFKFKMYAQIADAGDKIRDPSIAWPESRKKVLLGTITVTRLAPNTTAEDQALAFNPINLPDGIKTADPMLDFRGKAYPISVAERRAKERASK